METSAKTAMNVNEIFMAIGEHIKSQYTFLFSLLSFFYTIISKIFVVDFQLG